MKTRKIGQLEVSEIGMGCMGFSHGYGAIPPQADSIAAIRSAYEAGCTFFDTAEVYGDVLYYPGHNEEIVGKALAPFRKEAVLATKLHLQPQEIEKDGSVSASVRRHLLKSLKNLGTDYVDLYYLHRVHPQVDNKEVAAAMGALIQEGLIRGWGLSQVGVATIADAHAVTPLSAVQNIYSMVERDVEKEVIPYCLENGIGVVPFSPIASGLLSGRVSPDTQFERVDDVRVFVPQLKKENLIANRPLIDLLNEFAAAKGATCAQISLAWMLHKHTNVVPIPGSKNLQRILENLGAADVELSESEFSSLEAALGKVKIHGHRGFEESAVSTFGDNWKKEKN